MCLAQTNICYISRPKASFHQNLLLQQRDHLFADSTRSQRRKLEAYLLGGALHRSCRRNQPSAVDDFPCDHLARKEQISEQISSTLFQMSLRECSSCRDPLHDADGHDECVACLGIAHAEAALAGTPMDLALRATKATTQVMGKAMANLVVLESHLWLNLTDIKDVEKMAFIDSPVSPKGLLDPGVGGFTATFTEAQKTSQALRHLLPKRSSSVTVSSRPKPASMQPEKTVQP